jgi:hypothetical protein
MSACTSSPLTASSVGATRSPRPEPRAAKQDGTSADAAGAELDGTVAGAGDTELMSWSAKVDVMVSTPRPSSSE